MAKNIVIFSDGTGQIGGIRPDQRLSNVYKMYRAMRPGPDSPIKPSEQVCFYDPGLGAGEVEGLTFKRIKNILAAAIGTGIDENVIDCYEKIISHYEPGDKIILIGFSRGAYTARCVANTMNLCGIPTQMPGGKPVPRYGKHLRKIASDAVNYVYNHGTGKPRTAQPYFKNREELGKRFRKKYSSAVPGIADDKDVQGNVQPDFIGVFDTVAALGNGFISGAVCTAMIVLGAISVALWHYQWHWIICTIPLLAIVSMVSWYIKIFWSQFKYFSPNPAKRLNVYNPLDWPMLYKTGHQARWNMEHYDKFLDGDVRFARHALAIDEQRKDFARVEWGQKSTAKLNEALNPIWLKQVWFAGCHSDVGGSYPEDESRLSDIALDWMVKELQECVPDVKINKKMLVRSPDALGLQHKEIYMLRLGKYLRRWAEKPREVVDFIPLHPSVLERLKAKHVQQLDEIKPYRPEQLKDHPQAKAFFDNKKG